MNLYQEIILEHSKRPHHAGLRDPFKTQVHHINPTRGDGRNALTFVTPARTVQSFGAGDSRALPSRRGA